MALREDLVLKANGLYTYSDQLSEVPEGSLRRAVNVVIDKDGLVSPRRGFQNLAGTVGGAVDELFTYTYRGTNYLLSHYDNDTLAAYDDDTDTWTPYATGISQPTNAENIRSARSNKNIYFTSNQGVQKLDDIAGDLQDAGAPEGLDFQATLEDLLGTANWLPTGEFVAYRHVWGYIDNNDNLVLGAPSSPLVIENTDGATRGVTLEVTIPTTSVDSSWFLQIYRTNTNVAAPGDNMQLTLEQTLNSVTTTLTAGIDDLVTTITVDDVSELPTAGYIQINNEVIQYTGISGNDLTGATRGVDGTTAASHLLGDTVTKDDIRNGTFIATDYTFDAFLGADLYTNATQEGVLQSNFQPPQCVDLALFQNYLFYAGTQTTYSFSATLLGAKLTSPETPLQLTLDDTVTINGVTYTAKATEDIASDHFEVFDTASTATNIESTARSLVRVINRSTNNTDIWAVYDSGDAELPGKIRLFERDFGDATAFTFTSSRGAAWTPNTTTAQTATNDDKPNRLFFSKFQQPESVPLLNFFDVGAANDRILRIVPLRTILLIFTTAGIYKLSGTTQSSFSVTLLDDTAKLIAPRSLVTLNNTAVGLFDQGVAQVSYSSVQVLSRPIEGELNEIRGDTVDTLEPHCFGISYESDRKYILGIPTSNTSTRADIFYVYNTVTRSWTNYDLQESAGIVRDEDDKLYLAVSDNVIVERKSFDETDYVEPEFSVTVNAVSGTTLTLASVAGILAGYQYFESVSKFSTIQSVDAATSTIVVLDDLNWTTGTYEVRPFITTDIEWNPALAGSPNILKQFSEVTLLVNRPIQEATISFKTLASSDFEDVDVVDNSLGLWGLFEWGNVPWGGSTTVFRYRTYVPRNKQRDSALILRLRQNTVYNDFEIAGWSLVFRNISNRVTR